MLKSLICKIKGHRVTIEKYIRCKVYHTDGMNPYSEAETIYEFTCLRCGKYPIKPHPQDKEGE